MEKFKRPIKHWLPWLPVARQELRFFVDSTLGSRSYGSISSGEVEFFNAIKDDIKNVFDVGVRCNVDYLELTDDPDVDFYLFEPNVRFYKELERKVKALKKPNKISLFNVAIGDKEGFIAYYNDSQSVLKSARFRPDSRHPASSPVRLRMIDGMCEELGVAVDFLKTDIEDFDYFAILGAMGQIAASCRYIQFELGVGGVLDGRSITNEDYLSLLGGIFDLFILKDEVNPIWRDRPGLPTLIELDEATQKRVRDLQRTGVGFNVVGIRKNLLCPPSLLRRVPDE